MSKLSKSYRYIGVDPGTNVMGYAVIEVVSKKVRVLDIGVINMQKLTSHQLKLKRIFERITQLIDLYKPDEMAIEAPFFGKNVQAMLKLGRAQGVAMAAGITKGVEVTEYSPREIKKSVAGNGNASKEQVAAMLNQIFKYNVTNHYPLDATDALGAALCHYYRAGNPLSGKKQYKDWSSYLSDNPKKKAK